MDKEKIWKTVLENLKINLSSASYSTWFAHTFIIGLKSVGKKRLIVEVGCPSEFVRNTVETRYYGLIKDVLDQAAEKKCDLVFRVKESTALKSKRDKTQNGPLFQVKSKKPVGW